jgi:hypothetical protein
VCTTSMCSNIDHLNWELDVYWRVCTTAMSSNTDHLEWHLDVYWRCVLRQCATTLITLNETMMSIGGVYYINVQQHWSPLMASWCLLEVCTTSMCINIDHLGWDRDFYWRCVLRQSAVTLITLNDILMSSGGVYYINVQQHWSPWMRPWCLLDVCTTSMCSNIDHLDWHIDVYWRVRTTTMCSNTDHLEWYLDVYWRCVLLQCAATLITLNDILMSTGGCVLRQCAATLITLNETVISTGGVYYVNVQ